MVTVHRSNIVEDMMSAYVDQDIVKSFITIQFKDECGLDFDGIKREAYSLFWENAIPRYFEGTLFHEFARVSKRMCIPYLEEYYGMVTSYLAFSQFQSTKSSLL